MQKNANKKYEPMYNLIIDESGYERWVKIN